MIESAIGLGLFISLIFSETLGVAAGGMVVPGYLALMVHDPMRIAGTIIVSLVTRPRPESELGGLVYSLTPRPSDGALPWLHRPLTLGIAVLILTAALNMVFF